MKYTIIYNVCMIVSTLIEFFLVFDFYKAFHPKKKLFCKPGNEIILFLLLVVANIVTNLQNNNQLNFVITCILFLLVGFILVEGNIFFRLFHCVLLIFVVFSSELIFFFLLNVSVNSPTNEIYDNEFIMVSSIIAMKVIEFMLLTLIKQVSKIQVKKVSAKVFGVFIIVPIATLGLLTFIPYIRVGGDEITTLDIVVLIFYLILFCGNIGLFYIFTRYSQLQEQKMLLEVSQAKYEERRSRHNKEKELEEKYKEHIHDIKYYLKQIGIYLNDNRLEEIRSVLEELQIGIYKEERNVICANRFLNSILVDFKEEAEKNNVQADIFVEAGFKIEYMREIDITSLFGNLLDNALEAAVKCEHAKICVQLYMQNRGDLAVYVIKNTYNGEILRNGKQFLTTKEEKMGHGIGLRNVNRIVETYNGFLQQSYDDDIYVTTILIPVKAL